MVLLFEMDYLLVVAVYEVYLVLERVGFAVDCSFDCPFLYHYLPSLYFLFPFVLGKIASLTEIHYFGTVGQLVVMVELVVY